MTTTTASREISLSEFLTLPEDFRAELLDGRLEVSPEPTSRHQRAVRRLAHTLEAQLPPTLEAHIEVSWKVDERWMPAPDILVSPEADWVHFEGVPALAVEVLGPGNRTNDLVVKRRAYAEAGLPFYWVVDVDVPSVTAHALVGGVLEVALAVEGEDVADLPFDGGTVAVRPADLVRLRA